EELNDTSRLNASGRGRAFLKGSFTLNLHVEKGEIAIPYLSSDSEIDIDGDYVFKETEEQHDMMHVYYIKSADVKISGSDKTVMLRGANITLAANGAGYSTFVGTGTYRIENAGGITTEQRWEPPIFEEEMHPHSEINLSKSKPSDYEMNSSKFKDSDDEIDFDKLNPLR
ncbi:MAG TPA: hypothetical protein VN278_04195, partial [Methanosarcina sp.]|nr:hypothetical protein [Methanosarcina sp.]